MLLWCLAAALSLLLHSWPAAAAAATNSTTTTNAQAAAPAQLPAFCNATHPYADAGAPTTMAWAGNMLKVYHNLRHHNGCVVCAA
jgi:hypothetical protein